MVKNRTGFSFLTPNNSLNYSQYFGMLVYSKNPVLPNSEVQHFLSGKSFASAGWSGTQQTIDPINGINFTLLSNRSHNRMTVIAEDKKGKVIEQLDSKKIIYLPNGQVMIDATSYAYDRDDVVRSCLELALKYKILEDITGYSKNNDKVDESSRKIK